MGLIKRLQPFILSKFNARYEDMVAERKRALLGDLHGRVLEIGPGTGANLPHYPAGVQWIGAEPNPYMHSYLKKKADELGMAIGLRRDPVPPLPAATDSVDAVVSTLVLCSVADVPGTLREVLRVLRPGGRFVFIEHVAAPRGTGLRRWQSGLRPLWKRLADGCRPDRETGAAIERAGFARVDIQPFRLPLPIVGPHIAGVAVK